MADKDNKEFPKIKITGLDDYSFDKPLIRANETDDSEQAARAEQRMLDEALVRTVIRIVSDNEDLRRELLQALGIKD